MIRILQNQSLPDIAIRTAGSIEAMFDLAVTNGISITDSLEAGRELIEVSSLNRDMSNYYASRDIRPATAITEAYENEGIGFWAIDINFVVS